MAKPSKKNEPRLSLFAGGLPGLARGERATAARAKKVARPTVKRARAVGEELVDARAIARAADELGAAMRRKPTHEGRLAAVLRALGPSSAELRAELLSAGEALLRRKATERDIWSAIVRTLAEHDDPHVDSLLEPALAEPSLGEAGGAATLSAAGLSSAAALAPRLAKLATAGKPFVAFAAEIGRVVRGDSPGAHLLHLAPIIKEAHRVALATSIVAPLVRGLAGRRRASFAVDVGARLEPGFAVLRSAERHLGRWLLFGEAVVLAGDDRPLAEARTKSKEGPESSRGAWSLVAWALASSRGGATDPPGARPTTEISARLSDRPSADRDLSFLFRMGDAGVPSAKPMLESLVRGPLAEEAPVRAAAILARAFGRDDLLAPLRAAATTAPDEIRGLTIASLFDAGDRDVARELAEGAVASKHLPTAAWGGLVLGARGMVVTEPLVRQLQWGAVE